MAVQDEPGGAVQDPAIAAPPAPRAALPPPPALAPQRRPAVQRSWDGHGSDQLTGRDGREPAALRGVIRRFEQCRRREHRGTKKGPAEQRPAHLLGHDAEFGEASPGAAVRLRDRQPEQPELIGHPMPGIGVVAAFGGHQPAHFGFRRRLVQELAYRAPQFLLLGAEREVHLSQRAGRERIQTRPRCRRRSPWTPRTRPPRRPSRGHLRLPAPCRPRTRTTRTRRGRRRGCG